MSTTTTCPRCHAPLDASGFAAGTEVACPTCGEVFRVGRAEPTPPPMPARSKAPVRKSRRALGERRERMAADAPSVEEIQRRFAAAKLCRNAFFLAIGSIIGYFFAGFFVLPVALVAMGMGIVGLTKLAAVGPGRPLTQCDAGRERLAARMAKAARSRAWIAIGIGIGVSGLVAYTVWSLQQEQEREEEASERFQEELRELLGPGE